MRNKIILALIMGAGAYLRLHNLDWGLPEVFEEATPWRQAWEMWGFGTGRLDFNPRFFHYPAFTFYIQWIGQAFIYLAGRVSGEFTSPHQMQAAVEGSPYRFFVVGRLITSLFGVVSVYLVYRLGKDLYSQAAGLLAALFLSFNFSHIARGQLITTDVPLLFFVLLAFVPILRIARQARRRDYIWAGVFVGLATGVKYPGVLAGIGIIAAHLYFHMSQRHGLKRAVLSSSLWASAGIALMVFFCVSPYCFIDYSGFYRDFSFEQTHMTVGHFGAPDRLTSYGDYLFSIIPGILTLPVLGLALGGLVYALRRDRYLTAMLLAFPLVYFAVVGSWKTAAEHYILPVIPFLLILAGLLLWRIFDRPRFPGRALLLGLAACLFLIPSLVQIRDQHLSPEVEDNRTLARLWMEKNVRKGAAIVKERITPRLDEEDYLIFDLPLSTVYPKETELFYDLGLYRDFDYVITSSEVYMRYMRKPDDYPVHVRFYKDLAESGQPVKQFNEETGSGPLINIYHLARQPGVQDNISEGLYPRLMETSDPEANARILSNLAMVLSRKRSHEGAVQFYRIALAVDSTLTRAWHNLGLTLTSLGRIRESENALRQAVRLDSTYAGAWFALGHLNRQTGNVASSLDAYERGLRYEPYRLDIMRILSEMYLRAGRTDEALRIAERGLEASRGSHEFYFTLGCIHMVNEEYDKAIGSLASALDEKPRDGRYAYSLAGAYYSRGDMDRAMHYARRAQELGFDAGDLIDMIEAPSGAGR